VTLDAHGVSTDSGGRSTGRSHRGSISAMSGPPGRFREPDDAADLEEHLGPMDYIPAGVAAFGEAIEESRCRKGQKGAGNPTCDRQAVPRVPALVS
jgi:hypothetical protein